MTSNAVFLCLFVALLPAPASANLGENSNANNDANSDTANPIRRVVSLLQNMAKKVEAEGKKEQELYDKYMCYCKTSGETLGQSISDNNAQIPSIQSDIEESTSKLSTTKAELAQHRTDRDAAKAAMAKATAIREKEYAAYTKERGPLKSNIDALAKAIPAIEKGMAGQFLQTDAAAMIRRVALSDVDLSDFDRDSLIAFMQGGTGSMGVEGYVPKGGQIVGILKTMKADFDKDLADLDAQEASAKKTYDELMAAKTKEVEAHVVAIERKTTEVGELSVSIVNMKNSLSDSEAALVEDTKFLKDLEANCGTKEKEQAERIELRGQELLAISETIKILNDDDALELFKKTLPSPSLLQMSTNRDKIRQGVLKAIKSVRKSYRLARPEMDLIALALTGKKVDFSKVIKMIDDMVEIMAKEQVDDDNKKEYCEGQLDFAEDKAKGLAHTIEDLGTEIANTEEVIKSTTDELTALVEGIEALDKAVLESAIQRRTENKEYTELMAGNTAAKQLIEFAKNRMQKFYNPKLYKPPPKRELTEEEKMYVAQGGELEPTPAPGGIAGSGVGFLQVVTVNKVKKDEPPPPPEAPAAYEKKSEESGGVLAMMDLLVRDLDKEMQEAEVEEKDSQKEYEDMMDDAAKKRAMMKKEITEKESVKAEAEEDHTTAVDAKTGSDDELMATKEYIHTLHGECDWLLQNFDVRKEARAEEVDALKKAKATLQGADFSLVQKHRNL